MTRIGRTTPSRMVFALFAAFVLLAGACGDDDSGGGNEATDATDAPSDTGDDSGGQDVDAWCDASVALDRLFASDQGPDPEQLESALADFEATAPDAAQGDVDTLVGILGAGGDPFENPEFGEAYQSVSATRIEECGYSEVEVAGIDYAFEGIPETIEAGKTAFTFTNEAPEEFHEMVVFLIADGEDRPLDELLALGEAEAAELLTPQTAAFAPPGGTFTAFAELEPGRYAAVCFVPVGGAEDGAPHFVEGMLAEFDVT
jgi:hypothetical protein